MSFLHNSPWNYHFQCKYCSNIQNHVVFRVFLNHPYGDSFPKLPLNTFHFHYLTHLFVFPYVRSLIIIPIVTRLKFVHIVSNDLMCYKILQQIIYLNFFFLLACCPFASLYMFLSSTSLWNLWIFQLSSNNFTLVSFLWKGYLLVQFAFWLANNWTS